MQRNMKLCWNSAHRKPSHSILQQQQWHNHLNSRKRTAHQHIRHLCRCATHFARHSYNLTINSRSGQLTLHTDLLASDSGAVRRKGRTILGAKSKVLYNEIAVSLKQFKIGHMFMYTFLLRMTDNMTARNIELSSWDTCMCIYMCVCVCVCVVCVCVCVGCVCVCVWGVCVCVCVCGCGVCVCVCT